MPKKPKITEDERIIGQAILKALSSGAKNNYTELFEEFGIAKQSRNFATAIACAGIKKAAAGDKAWAEFIRNTITKAQGDGAKEGVVIVDDIKA